MYLLNETRRRNLSRKEELLEWLIWVRNLLLAWCMIKKSWSSTCEPILYSIYEEDICISSDSDLRLLAQQKLEVSGMFHLEYRLKHRTLSEVYQFLLILWTVIAPFCIFDSISHEVMYFSSDTETRNCSLFIMLLAMIELSDDCLSKSEIVELYCDWVFKNRDTKVDSEPCSRCF
jgi:hypothetical protein